MKTNPFATLFNRIKNFFTNFNSRPAAATAGNLSGSISKNQLTNKKEKETTSDTATPNTSSAINIHFPRFRTILITTVILLVVREAFPAVAEALEPVYTLLDTIVLPVVNWAYRLVLKVLTEVISWKWVANIINWFGNLAM